MVLATERAKKLAGAKRMEILRETQDTFLSFLPFFVKEMGMWFWIGFLLGRHDARRDQRGGCLSSLFWLVLILILISAYGNNCVGHH